MHWMDQKDYKCDAVFDFDEQDGMRAGIPLGFWHIGAIYYTIFTSIIIIVTTGSTGFCYMFAKKGRRLGAVLVTNYCLQIFPYFLNGPIYIGLPIILFGEKGEACWGELKESDFLLKVWIAYLIFYGVGFIYQIVKLCWLIDKVFGYAMNG